MAPISFMERPILQELFRVQEKQHKEGLLQFPDT